MYRSENVGKNLSLHTLKAWKTRAQKLLIQRINVPRLSFSGGRTRVQSEVIIKEGLASTVIVLKEFSGKQTYNSYVLFE